MHELSLCQAVAASVARRAGGRQVVAVQVRIGHLRQVVPDALTFAWEVLTAGSSLDGARLDVEHVPATLECRACGATSTLDAPLLLCRECGSDTVDVRSGDELLVVSFEVAAAPAPTGTGGSGRTGRTGGEETPDGPVPSSP